MNTLSERDNINKFQQTGLEGRHKPVYKLNLKDKDSQFFILIQIETFCHRYGKKYSDQKL